MVYQLESPDINTVINYCKDLCANGKIEVYDFGEKQWMIQEISMFPNQMLNWNESILTKTLEFYKEEDLPYG